MPNKLRAIIFDDDGHLIDLYEFTPKYNKDGKFTINTQCIVNSLLSGDNPVRIEKVKPDLEDIMTFYNRHEHNRILTAKWIQANFNKTLQDAIQILKDLEIY